MYNQSNLFPLECFLDLALQLCGPFVNSFPHWFLKLSVRLNAPCYTLSGNVRAPLASREEISVRIYYHFPYLHPSACAELENRQNEVSVEKER